MKMNSLLLPFWLVVSAFPAFSQRAPSLLPPDERYKADILLVVAHPDDETAISSYLARAGFDQQNESR